MKFKIIDEQYKSKAINQLKCGKAAGPDKVSFPC